MKTNREMFRKAIVEDAALPAAGDNLLASTISPSQNETGYFRIYGTISISGILTVKVNSSEEKMNAGIAIGAGVAFLFDIPVTRGDVVSVLFSETTGTIGRIVIDEHSG